jgi:hypothetical protein
VVYLAALELLVLLRMQPPVALILAAAGAHDARPFGQRVAALSAGGSLRWASPTAPFGRALEDLLTVLGVVASGTLARSLRIRGVSGSIAGLIPSFR